MNHYMKHKSNIIDVGLGMARVLKHNVLKQFFIVLKHFKTFFFFVLKHVIGMNQHDIIMESYNYKFSRR
jgi:hypothetical protein